MILIFAVDRNFSIGLDGDMLFYLKEDLTRFKKITSGHIMVMGRKTLESLPGGLPLKNRTNIVLTRDKNYKKDGVTIVNDLSKLFEKIEEIKKPGQEVFLIGGGDLVAQLVDKCEKAYITYVDKEFPEFDTKIPHLDQLDNWELVQESSPVQEDIDGEIYKYTYRVYINTECK